MSEQVKKETNMFQCIGKMFYVIGIFVFIPFLLTFNLQYIVFPLSFFIIGTAMYSLDSTPQRDEPKTVGSEPEKVREVFQTIFF